MIKCIGFCGLARAGKDTAAEAVRSLGWHRMAFADGVRTGLLSLNPTVDVTPLLDRWWKQVMFDNHVPLQFAVAEFGWEDVKSLPEVRGLLQRYGDEAGRQIHGNACWVDYARVKMEKIRRTRDISHFVLSDVRYVNEVDFIRNTGGDVWWVDRDGVERMPHASENQLKPGIAREVLINNDCKEHFQDLVRITIADWMAQS